MDRTANMNLYVKVVKDTDSNSMAWKPFRMGQEGLLHGTVRSLLEFSSNSEMNPIINAEKGVLI